MMTHTILKILVFNVIFGNFCFETRKNPDEGQNTNEIIKARGFPCEIHNITTRQGYIVTAFRLPNPGSKVVILQTGLIGSSNDFIMANDDISHNKSIISQCLGFELYKQGFDVWLTNNRGNRYGIAHTTLDPKEKIFWDFTFDEMSEYDIPAFIEYILNYTGQSRLHYIGHSQGSAVMFALLSQTDRYNNIIETFTAISPITRIAHAKTSFRNLLNLMTPFLTRGGPVFTQKPFVKNLVSLTCDTPFFKFVCIQFFFSMAGRDYEQLNKTRMGVYISNIPTSTAAKNLIHFKQMFHSNEFKKFDYGIDGNEQHYNSTTPPKYKLDNITHPNVLVIYSLNDYFVPLDGVQTLKSDLKQAKFYQISNEKSNHMDPLIGIDIAKEVNYKIIDYLKSFDKK